ncbi:fungal-specific transcription factor domain-containing protein [Gloeopeniophorella convolvens]|nr:fungal-specific transcription factor domain-containing protein [Gloeopeniophorella convolvens]
MPVDLSKSHADRRKPSRDVTVGVRQDGMHSREIEMKRNRGEISCAECRRLKIKCDKQIPCQSCQRRGCAALCPNGSLATGQGTRFVIAATEHLHRRITRMSDRIRQLEDALSVLQASHSTEPHPLLRENFSVADSADKPEEQLQEEEEDAPADVVNAFGTMSISDHGVSRFFGPTGGSDLLLLENEDLTGSPSQKTDSSDSSKTYSLPPELKRFSYAFPFTPVGSVEGVIALIRNHLPPWEQALSICESYLENAAWLFRSVSRQQLIHEMLPAIYRKQPAYPPDDYSGPHDLALLFSVFALGSIVDVKLSTPAAEAEGEHYNQLALAALCLQPVLEKPSLVTIQTLHVSSIYNAMSGSEVSSGESSMETTWSLVALAAHLSQTIGLHRDPARWETDPKVVQRRRMVFWDLFIADSWHTLSTGRPPAFNRAYIDCQFPQDEDLPSSLEGGAIASFGVWGFRFSFECVAEVAARTLTATAPRYSTVTELDRKVREFDISPQMLEAIRGGPDVDPRNIPISASMTAFMLSHLREVILMFLHRSFFAQALIEDPENPVRSQYAPSFLATVRSAAKILSDVHEQFAIQPVILSRFWSIWTYAFSSAVVFGSIVTRGPRSHLADSAMAELNGACALFAKASKVNRRAAKAHVILGRLRDKAQRAIAAVRGPAPTPQSDGAAWGIKEEEIEDELAVFAGRTRVFRSAGTRTSTRRSCTNRARRVACTARAIHGIRLALRRSH